MFSYNSAIAAADIVYPSSKESVINAPDTFVFGNTTKGSKLLINNNPAKLWADTFFVEIIDLDYGKNKIVFSEIKDGKTDSSVYYITRNKISSSSSKTQKKAPIKFPENEIWYTKTLNDNSTVREKPSSSAKRIVELGKNTVLYLEAKQGDYYKLQTGTDNEFWIYKTNIAEPVKIAKKMENIIKEHKYIEDERYEYHKFYVTYPVFYTVKQIDNSLKLTLYGINLENFEYVFNFDKPILGYDCYYEDNKFVLKTAKVPEISEENILKDINIFIDAGHGGAEKGAAGPTRIYEKDINLDIAKRLIALLQNDGANVSYSRMDDIQTGLYERVKKAKDNNALISISIHNNSLPSGKNPYVQHGCEVHYYNDNAEMLAKIININLSQDLNLKNNGIHRSSFALNRSTNPVSVLVETAYMINPEEYLLLQNPEFRQKAALSMEKSLKQYISLIQKQL